MKLLLTIHSCNCSSLNVPALENVVVLFSSFLFCFPLKVKIGSGVFLTRVNVYFGCFLFTCPSTFRASELLIFLGLLMLDFLYIDFFYWFLLVPASWALEHRLWMLNCTFSWIADVRLLLQGCWFWGDFFSIAHLVMTTKKFKKNR